MLSSNVAVDYTQAITNAMWIWRTAGHKSIEYWYNTIVESEKLQKNLGA